MPTYTLQEQISRYWKSLDQTAKLNRVVTKAIRLAILAAIPRTNAVPGLNIEWEQNPNRLVLYITNSDEVKVAAPVARKLAKAGIRKAIVHIYSFAMYGSKWHTFKIDGRGHVKELRG